MALALSALARESPLTPSGCIEDPKVELHWVVSMSEPAPLHKRVNMNRPDFKISRYNDIQYLLFLTLLQIFVAVSSALFTIHIMTDEAIRYKVGRWGDFYSSDYYLITLSVLITLLFVLIAILTVITIASGLPNIVLSEEFLTQNLLLRRKIWRWDEVGPFELRLSRGQYTAHAMSLTTPDSPHASATPRAVYSGVTLELDNLSGGRSRDGAAEIIRRLNEWRSRYGTPTTSTTSDSQAERSDSRRHTDH